MKEITNTESSSGSGVGDIDRNKILLAGRLGVLADLASGYSLEGAANITTAFPVYRWRTSRRFWRRSDLPRSFSATTWRSSASRSGSCLWQVYQAIQPAGWALSRTAWFVGVLTFIIGTVFHSTFGIQAADGVPPAGGQAMRTMLDRIALVFEPLAVLMVGGLVVALGLMFVGIAFR